jgi:hypothetical protein
VDAESSSEVAGNWCALWSEGREISERRFFRVVMTHESGVSSILAEVPLSPDEAEWIQLKKIIWTDPKGQSRVWESAERKTRKANSIDGTALHTKTN